MSKTLVLVRFGLRKYDGQEPNTEQRWNYSFDHWSRVDWEFWYARLYEHGT